MFLTEREINFMAMCQALPNTWQPGCGIEIDELEGCLYLFCYHYMLDVRRVITKDHGALPVTSWSHKNYVPTKLPNQAPLNLAAFWIQVHKLPFLCFSELTGRVISARANSKIPS
ncbi:hypothetical protein LINGRAHAP2_LOCUS19569 [Linum grandiflorum]